MRELLLRSSKSLRGWGPPGSQSILSILPRPGFLRENMSSLVTDGWEDVSEPLCPWQKGWMRWPMSEPLGPWQKHCMKWLRELQASQQIGNEDFLVRDRFLLWYRVASPPNMRWSFDGWQPLVVCQLLLGSLTVLENETEERICLYTFQFWM